MEEEKGETRVVDDDDKYHSIRSSNKKKKKTRGATEKKVNYRFGTARLSAHERTVPMTLHYGYNARPLLPRSGYRFIVKDMQTADNDSIYKY